MSRIKVPIARAGETNDNSAPKHSRENIFRPARMIIRSHNDHTFPSFFLQQFSQRLGFFPCAVCVLRKWEDALFGDAALDQVVSHEFSNSCVWPKANSARHDHRRKILAKEFRGTSCALGVKLIVS